MKQVQAWAWGELDWFWFCFERRAGWNGWELQRIALPDEGPIGSQDHFRMWCQQILSHEFIKMQNEQAEESQRARELAQTHEKLKKAQGDG